MAGKQSANSTGMSIRRNGRIDFLRCLFAVIIMLHHSRYVLGYDNSIFIGGSMAVEFFFMVSGYLMMNTVPKRCAADRKNGTKPEIGSETWQFLRHKIRAFLPEFLIAWCIGFVLVATIENYHGVHLWHVFRDDFFELSLLKMSGIFTGGIDGVIWYLSAMLLCMAILYPLLRSFKDLMTHIVCPLTALMLMGYLCQTEGSPRDPTKFLHLVFKGDVRAMAELCMGVVIWMAVQHLKKVNWSRLAKNLMGLAEIGLYLMVVQYMWDQKPTKTDYFYIFCLMIAVLLTFADTGALKTVFGRSARTEKITSFLAKYSTALYFSHLYIAQHLNTLLPEDAYSARLRAAVYIIWSLANGFVVMGLAFLARKAAPAARRHLARLFVNPEKKTKTSPAAAAATASPAAKTAMAASFAQPVVLQDEDRAILSRTGSASETVHVTTSETEDRKKTLGGRIRHYRTKFVYSIRHYQFMFEELVKRDFKQRYKRSVLGMAWSVLSPLLTLLVMRVIFTNFFAKNISHYTIYLFSGNIIMSYFRESTKNGMRSLTSNSKIFTKINVPKYLFLLSKNVSALVNFGLTLIVYFGFCVIDHITFTPKMILLVYPSLCLLVMNIGIGALLSAMYVFFEDTSYLYDVLLTLINYMSVIFYSIDSWPTSQQRMFLINPIYVYIKYFRTIVIDGVVPSPMYHLLCLFYALFYLIAGMLVYRKYNHEFLYYL